MLPEASTALPLLLGEVGRPVVQVSHALGPYS